LEIKVPLAETELIVSSFCLQQIKSFWVKMKVDNAQKKKTSRLQKITIGLFTQTKKDKHSKKTIVF
jgi:hypothetical protein